MPNTIGTSPKNRSRIRITYRNFMEAGIEEGPSDVSQDVVANALPGFAGWVERTQEMLGKADDDRNVPGGRDLGKHLTVAQIQKAVSDEVEVESSVIVSRRLRNNKVWSTAFRVICKLMNESMTELAR